MMRCSGRNRIPWVSLTVNGRPEAAIVLTAIFPGRADARLAHSVRYGEANAPRNPPQGGCTSASHIAVSGTTFDCTASPYLWRHGHGVQIDITTSGKHVGGVRVVCPFDQPEFHTLASLFPRELCDLALSRFTSGQLPVTLEAVLRWQEEIASMGYDYTSPLISLFSRSGLRLAEEPPIAE